MQRGMLVKVPTIQALSQFFLSIDPEEIVFEPERQRREYDPEARRLQDFIRQNPNAAPIDVNCEIGRIFAYFFRPPGDNSDLPRNLEYLDPPQLDELMKIIQDFN